MGVGCTTTLSPRAAMVVEADEEIVQGCEFIGSYEGNSVWGGKLVQSTGMKNSKNEVVEKAASHGATHIVFYSVAGGPTPFASGRAYKCKKH
jgi:hypothetical protein